MTGLFAKPVDPVPQALQRAIHLEELVVFRAQLRPEHVAVELLLRRIRNVHTAHFRRSRRFGGMLRMCAGKTIAQVKQRVIVPRPLGRNFCWRAGIRSRANRFIGRREALRGRFLGWSAGRFSWVHFHFHNIIPVVRGLLRVICRIGFIFCTSFCRRVVEAP